MKTSNEKNFDNRDRDAERGEHGDGTRRVCLAQSFIIAGGVTSFQNGDR